MDFFNKRFFYQPIHFHVVRWQKKVRRTWVGGWNNDTLSGLFRLIFFVFKFIGRQRSKIQRKIKEEKPIKEIKSTHSTNTHNTKTISRGLVVITKKFFQTNLRFFFFFFWGTQARKEVCKWTNLFRLKKQPWNHNVEKER